MDIKVFTKSANHPRFAQTLVGFAQGVSRAGDNVQIIESDCYVPCDVAVIFGSWKDRPNVWHQVKNQIVNNAPNFIVLETPILGRKEVKDIMPDDWYRIGVNGFLRDTGNFNNKNKPSDRWEIIQKDLGVTCEDWEYNEDGPIVVALQIPGDASLKGANIDKWAYDRIVSIRSITDREIILRTPQLNRQFDIPKILTAGKNIRVQEGTKENLIPTLKSAYCTVTYSSGLGVDSVLAGCPTIAYNPSNFAYDISSRFITDLNNIKRNDRTQWLNNLSYCQWSLAEIINGVPWVHLREVL